MLAKVCMLAEEGQNKPIPLLEGKKKKPHAVLHLRALEKSQQLLRSRMPILIIPTHSKTFGLLLLQSLRTRYSTGMEAALVL